ncbi:MAG: F0F1 ATP synthase subunit alpha [Firmicutes bacterium]|nr:F0F1 ATP synthase subunit alpha [Bacillota bacterium]
MAADIVTAKVTGRVPPSPEAEAKLTEIISEKYGAPVKLVFERDSSIAAGFRLTVGDDIYDWSLERHLSDIKEKLSRSAAAENADGHVGAEGLIPLMHEAIEDWTPRVVSETIGRVVTVGDGIATVSGLSDAEYGEILLFDGGVRGLAEELDEDKIGCILFGGDENIKSGSRVYRTGKTAGIPVGEGFIGRVIDPLGTPLDGKGAIAADDYMPTEAPAPGIIDRTPVSTPLETGLLVIDSMSPIGRGQRELIIGDRRTGKTTIAVDTIINQKGKDVICIYVAIGQKASSVAKIADTLASHGAMEYTTVVLASASDSVPIQYIAPYAGCTLGEYFMKRGRDVLIVYDDLSKHAVAYRTMSLLLGRFPGREAYPGDVFYLHSRLLERAAKLSPELGGGSMTALPIVETLSGDVSAYIPTNTISITDGQIYLESNLFHSGQRPAVNVSLSVSRVGGDAQTPAMRSASKSLRLLLEQYGETEVFTRFSSDLDETTRRSIMYGELLTAFMRQPKNSPMSAEHQIIVLVAALSHAVDGVPASRAPEFALGLCAYFDEKLPTVSRELAEKKTLSDELREKIVSAASEYALEFIGSEN